MSPWRYPEPYVRQRWAVTLATTLAGVASPDQMKSDARKSGGLSALL